MKTILVLGASGQVASELKVLADQQKDFTFHFSGQQKLDFLHQDVFTALEETDADLIINTTAYTQVDKAELEVAPCHRLNAIIPGQLASYCHKRGLPFIHISTDYVYHSDTNVLLSEETPTQPKSVYGIAKRNGEQLVMELNPKSIIIRTSWLYSIFGHNFVKTMLKLGKEKKELNIVNDQIGAPTYAADLAKAILEIVKVALYNQNENIWGIYNYANEGQTNWADFARYLFQQKKLPISVHGISTQEYGAPAPRPLWSVMSTEKIKTTFNLEISHWKEAVDRCLSLL